MSTVLEIVRYVCGGIRETLPKSEHDAGVFLAGMTWAFVIYCLLLVAVSWLTVAAFGGRP